MVTTQTLKACSTYLDTYKSDAQREVTYQINLANEMIVSLSWCIHFSNQNASTIVKKGNS